MGYYTRDDLPFYYALADAFTICDGYHASVMGPTNPNRYYWMSASIDPDGKNGGPATNNRGGAIRGRRTPNVWSAPASRGASIAPRSPPSIRSDSTSS
jgi:phospholipase C